MSAISTGTVDNLSVHDFYVDRSVFVTGATGFIGKALVEKLLRSCPGIRNVYMLMRPKKNQDVKTRLQKYFEEPLFENLRRNHPKLFEKLIPIEGDLTLDNVGISQSDEDTLVRHVSVVFHSAATIKFDEPLKTAVEINVIGTKRVLDLSHKMPELSAFVYVSTAYCHCNKAELDEEIYSVPYHYSDIINMVNILDDKLLDEMTPILTKDLPNTYTFTKALCESLLQNEARDLPVAIIRPSIVMSACREPMIGWLDNWNGPTCLIGAAYKGFLRTMHCKKDAIADLVPVDFVINLIIVSAWKANTSKAKHLVYNCSTGERNAITWGEFADLCLTYIRKYPLNDSIWYPTGCYYNSKVINKLFSWLLHFLPAYVVDTVHRISGKKPIMMKLQNKLEYVSERLLFFTTREWKFKTGNVAKLYRSLSVKDKEDFPFDVTSIDWCSYIEGYILGIRQYLYHQSLDTLSSARKKLFVMLWTHNMVKFATLLLLYKSVSRIHRLYLLLHGLMTRFCRMIPYI